MSIPDETRSSEFLETYADYHLASIAADPTLESLVAPTAAVIDGLKAKRGDRQAADQKCVMAAALFARRDHDLDERTRVCELEALAASSKNRQDTGYRTAFPKGLTWLIGLRGQAQADATRTLAKALGDFFPEVAGRHQAALTHLADEVLVAERTLRETELERGNARTQEEISRSELVRQLHSNRGALRAEYPRNQRRVASYFPPSHSRAAAEPETEAPPEPPLR